MKTIRKKILPWYFEAVRNGTKTFEIRKDEDGFEVGDHILLCEWSGTAYTGFTLEAEITYILRDAKQYGLMNGYCILGIKALDKDIDVPSKSALDHIHNVVRDDAYKRGYEQGKAEKVPAITLEWIGEYLAWLKDIGGFGLSDARAIKSMIIKWKMDNAQKHSGCGPDYCKLGGEG